MIDPKKRDKRSSRAVAQWGGDGNEKCAVKKLGAIPTCVSLPQIMLPGCRFSYIKNPPPRWTGLRHLHINRDRSHLLCKWKEQFEGWREEGGRGGTVTEVGGLRGTVPVNCRQKRRGRERRNSSQSGSTIGGTVPVNCRQKRRGRERRNISQSGSPK